MKLIDAEKFAAGITLMKISFLESGDGKETEYKRGAIVAMETIKKVLLEEYTADYDVNAVVQQLKDRSILSRPVGWSKSYEIVTLEDAIEAVKDGGAMPGQETRTNFDACCESIENMAAVLDIAKAGWTKEQLMSWLKDTYNAEFPQKQERKKKERAISMAYNSHDCESRYRCPECGTPFGSWDVFRNQKNENGTNKYCPHCKTELDGLD